jgi:hypothetical protein
VTSEDRDELPLGYVDIETGEGFRAPRPAEAYKGAPDLMAESTALIELGTRRAAGAFDDDEHQERLYLLRRAALADRFALDSPGDEVLVRDAVVTSQALISFDREHGYDMASYDGPDSPEWDPSARPYVRACYSVWGWE